MPQMFGYHRAAEALLLGEPFMAEAALEVGLVNKVLPPTEANAYAQGVAKKLAAKPVGAVIATKRFMKQGLIPQLHQRMDEEGVVFGQLMASPEARQAFMAFMGGKK
jgi:enoyl-CoA hydratase/carnithine racemase